MTLKEKLSGKKILFFSVRTFNLEKEIAEKLRSYGAQVDYYDERPSNSIFTKGIIRVKRSVYQKKINSYYRHILSEISGKAYDILFVNRGEVIPEFFLEDFKKLNPTCECLYYNWDSFKNHRHPLKLLKYFDHTFSFDTEDCEKYGLKLRPLFFLDRFKSLHTVSEKNFKYDVLFLGTAHSDRYKISNEVAYWCENNNLSSYCFYYMQGRLVYLYKRLFDKSFQAFDYKKLSFKSLNSSEVLNLYSGSRIFLDINHPGQKGLTLRTFEAIGCGRKIITTNKEVKKYPFYDSQNILVIDRNELKLDETFFKSKYKDPSIDLYHKSSMEGWIEDIFIRENVDYWNNLVLNERKEEKYD